MVIPFIEIRKKKVEEDLDLIREFGVGNIDLQD